MNKTECLPDGIHALLSRDAMDPAAVKLRDTYARVPGAPLVQRPSWYYCLERWYEQGLPRDADLIHYFNYDPVASESMYELGWCEAAFNPLFEEKILEDRGDYELVQDFAGRHVLYFKGRRDGFMPEYTDHPVKDWKTWEENVKWRLNPLTSSRYSDLETRMAHVQAAARKGWMITQRLVGGYMYLRSLMGPSELLYAFYDQPDLIHDCMKTWYELADAVIARHQQYVTLDELFLAEDICFNSGPLISPDMIQEFLFPYYRRLIAHIRSRQIDSHRRLYIQIDTDGKVEPVIPLYQEIGMDAMSPFEVASGCDVVALGKDFPDLAMFGGIDKRILASTTSAIDRELERILPVMRERGGYIPMCDHGVPEEVSLENYKHYRKRCQELCG